MNQKPKSKSGVRLPAEWEPQSFLQLTFPHASSDWASMLNEATSCFVEIIQNTANFEPVLVVCDNAEEVRLFFENTNHIYFAEAPSNDTWARDHGGITVLKEGSPIIHDYIFNGWGNKFDATLDNQITQKLFDAGIFQDVQIESFDFVLEGGSIESDGNGTILTTSECLLENNRNPHYSKADIENLLKQNLGVERILWLDYGYLAGDDTDSHIDTLARFCDEHTIAYVGCHDPEDEHFEALRQMKYQLQELTDRNEKPFHLVELPLPDPFFDHEGNRLPATYVNFTIINGAVLVPVYGVSQDKVAVKILEGCFPNRKIIPVNCRVLIEQHGSLHCVTMQYPEQVGLNKLNIES